MASSERNMETRIFEDFFMSITYPTTNLLLDYQILNIHLIKTTGITTIRHWEHTFRMPNKNRQVVYFDCPPF